MKNKLLFMMLTILGAPGIAAAAGYDLANSEYNFAVNELSKSSFNQAAIIGQAGTNNSAQLRQGGSKLLAVVAQEGSSNRAKIDQTGDYNLAYIDQAGSANDASISQGAYGNTAMIIQKGLCILLLYWEKIHLLFSVLFYHFFSWFSSKKSI